MGLLRAFVLGLVIAFIIHNYHTVTVPQGVTQPYAVRVALGTSRLVFRLGWVLDSLGIVSDVTTRRYFVNASTAMGNLLRSPNIQTEDTSFGGIPVRVYTPTDKVDSGPAIIFYHGGGWIVGNVDSYQSVVAFMAKEANVVVVSVEYRLNPEFSHNDGLQDCLQATRYFLQNADMYNVDSSRVAVAGDSAGGNYAAVVALHLRDENFEPMPKLQVLIYPSVQAIDLMLPSYQQNADGPFIDKADMCWAKSYLNYKSNKHVHHFESNTHVSRDVRVAMAADVLNHDVLPELNKHAPYVRPDYDVEGNSEVWETIGESFLNPYHYPLMAKDHSNLPETYIFTAQFDQLRDDGYLYAHALTRSGVKVTHYNCKNCWHGMFNFMQALEHPKDVLKTIMTFVKDTL